MNLIYQNHGWNVQSVFTLLKPKPKALITENSTLIKHGMLGFFSPSSMKKKMRYIFLFDRAFIVTAPMKKKFRLKIYIHLRPGVELVDDPDDTQFRLNVTYKGKGVPMIMYADSIKEKNAWIRDIDTVLWKIRDGDCSLESGSGVLSSSSHATPFSPLSLSESDLDKAGADPRVNRKSAFIQSKEDEQLRKRRARANTTGTMNRRTMGPMTLDLSKYSDGTTTSGSTRKKQPSFSNKDSALRFSDSDSDDDEEERERIKRKAEKRKQSRDTSGRNPYTSPPGSQKKSSEMAPISPRAAQSQQVPTRTAPASTGATYPSNMQNSSMTNLTRGMDYMSLNPPSPLHSPPSSSLAGLMRQPSASQFNMTNYQAQLQQPLAQYQLPTAYGSNPQLLQQQQQVPSLQTYGSNPQLLQQQQPSQSPALPSRASQPISPPVSAGYAVSATSLSSQPLKPQAVASPPTSAAAKPALPQQQQQQQPILYAVPAQQQGQQGTYYMDPTAYAHYVQQLQMQQLQLLQQQQLLQQHQQGQQFPTAEKTV